jgi:glyoxylase-like metal-dependent hydrolase (beta-lactamase superfamily II)
MGLCRGRRANIGVRQSGLLLAGALFAGAAAADHMVGLPKSAQHQEVPVTVRQVAPDLYFHYNDSSSNSAFLVTGEGVLVVDSGQHPADGRALLERIRSVTDKPIKYVINTHFHGDHVLGNPAFRAAGAIFIAHRDTVTMMRTHYQAEIARRGDYYKRFNLDPAELRMDLPDVAYDGGMTITLGGRTVNVMYLGAGQNPGDTLVHFPHARAVFVGGPFARRNWSNTSFTPSIDGWIALLEKVAAMDVDRFLPGHGDIGNRQDVLDEADLLGDFQAGVKAALAQGTSREDMVKSLHFRQYKDLRNYDRLHGFINALHHLLTTGKPTIGLP